MKYKPHRYQTRAIKFGVERNHAGFFLDPGMGKTSIIYSIFLILRKMGWVKRMLVVAPLRPAQSTWPREREKWDDFRDLNVHVLHGSDKEELLKQPHDVSVINPEGLEWLLGEMTRSGYRRKGAAHKAKVWWDMLVVDESTRFKNPSTNRFSALAPHVGKFQRRYILTGSPAPNGLMDLFGQVFILDRGGALGQFITHFRSKYFYPTGFGGYEWKPQEDAEERIYKVLKPLVLRMAATDYLDLPPLLGVKPPLCVDVELPEKARKVYDQMEKLLMAQLDDGLLTAANVGAATQKCRQIANGGVYLEDDKFKNLHEVKTEAVLERIEELGGKPVCVAYEFKHDLDRLQRALKKAHLEFAYLGGGVTSKRQREVEDEWNAGGLQVLLAQPSSVAHGLNLQGVGAAVIFHSLIWNLEEYEQLIRRFWRQGQKERVMVHHVRALRTVDDAILRALARKDRTQQALLDALRTEIIER